MKTVKPINRQPLIKCLIVFGTRPEAIKFSPVILEIKNNFHFINPIVCVTGQHRDMLDDALDIFGIQPEYDLNIMQANQSLAEITCRVLQGVGKVIANENPDIMLIQGDTATAFAASLAAYYHHVPIGHVEAGLRSRNKYHPFPEEMNRHMIDVMSDLFFAPTSKARNNLLREGTSDDKIIVTGNTAIDALLQAVSMPVRNVDLKLFNEEEGRMILVTAHRREIFGNGLSSICDAVKRLAIHLPDTKFVYPVHPNPNVREKVYDILSDHENILLINPIPYLYFVHLMKRSTMILSDSGGIQEEAPALNKPLLILRDLTERPEVVVAGAAKLVGTDPDVIFSETVKILNDQKLYKKMADAENPFGDGHSANRIVSTIYNWFIGKQ